MALSMRLFFWTLPAIFICISYVLHLTIPTRRDSNYTPRSEFGLVPVDIFNSEVTGNGVDIIFVHGLGSNPDTTWQTLARSNSSDDCQPKPPSAGEKYVNWISDFLYDDLPHNIRRSARAFFYNYESYWLRDAIEERRSRLGLNLFNDVNTMAAKTPDRSIVFVGHSYGGLVIKEALIKANYLQSHRRGINVFERTKAVVFLGTPHRGSKHAWIGTIITHVLRIFGLKPNQDILEAIKYDSFELQDMHRHFEAISDPLWIVNFYEMRMMPMVWGLWSGFAVAEQSATLDRPRAENIGLLVDHTGLNKFGERNGEYNKIKDKLIQLLEPITRSK